MGFNEVYLLGCDCDYSKTHHFHGKDYSYMDDQVKQSLALDSRNEEMFQSYRIIKNAFEKDGRKIYNATVGGKLEVFVRKKLEDVIKKT